jgi:iron complex transport system ATP-binding protein
VTEPALVLDNVTFAYQANSARVLDGISVSVNPGEVLGVIGPNGAGKSTLVRLVAGLLTPIAGEARCMGRVISERDREHLAKSLAVVAQRDEVAFAYSAKEVVLMGRAPHTGLFGLESDADLRAAEDAMRACHAWELRSRKFSELSGGEQKRVAIARALAQATPVLVLDEPTAFLDIHHQIGILDLVSKRVREHGLAALLVIHDLNLAAQYCDRLLLLRNGKQVALGNIEEVMTYRQMREAFDVDVYVGLNELTGARYFVPIRGSADES